MKKDRKGSVMIPVVSEKEYKATDKIKALPRQFFLNENWVSIGGEAIKGNGETIRSATQEEYKYLFDLFEEKGLLGYLVYE